MTRRMEIITIPLRYWRASSFPDWAKRLSLDCCCKVSQWDKGGSGAHFCSAPLDRTYFPLETFRGSTTTPTERLAVWSKPLVHMSRDQNSDPIKYSWLHVQMKALLIPTVRWPLSPTRFALLIDAVGFRQPERLRREAVGDGESHV